MKQGIYELSSVQLYPIGKRLAVDERVFRYAQIAGVAAMGGRAVANLSTSEETGVAAADSAIGARTVTITVVSATGLEADELKGGYLTYKSTRFYCHRIASHPAAVFGATCVLTLETPIVGHAVENGVTVLNAFHNPWRAVGYGATYGSGVSFVGWPFGDIAIGQYAWVQTWGPVSGCPTDFFCGLPNERQAWFASDGSLATFAVGVDQDSYQHAGFWIPCSWYGAALHDLVDGGHLLFLQISP